MPAGLAVAVELAVVAGLAVPVGLAVVAVVAASTAGEIVAVVLFFMLPPHTRLAVGSSLPRNNAMRHTNSLRV